MLKAEGFIFPWLGMARAAVLAIAAAWSLVLAWGILRRVNAAPARRWLAQAAIIAAIGGVIAPWVMLLSIQAIVINRLAGLPYPLWAPTKVTPLPPRPPEATPRSPQE